MGRTSFKNAVGPESDAVKSVCVNTSAKFNNDCLMTSALTEVNIPLESPSTTTSKCLALTRSWLSALPKLINAKRDATTLASTFVAKPAAAKAAFTSIIKSAKSTLSLVDD